jgi:hypothetical protein
MESAWQEEMDEPAADVTPLLCELTRRRPIELCAGVLFLQVFLVEPSTPLGVAATEK